MLYPYQMYEKEIRQKFYKELHNINLKYFFEKGYRALPNTTKPGRYYAIASDTREESLFGYAFYHTDGSMMMDVNVVLFDYHYPEYCGLNSRMNKNTRDMLREAIGKFGITDIFLDAVSGGPMDDVYKDIITDFHGQESGTLHRRLRLEDGNLYDKNYYEIHIDENQREEYMRFF